MNTDRIMIAAPGSGNGKTTVTCALLRTLKERSLGVISYKCGPDYIDPMFHEKVLGIPSKNLDTFFTGETGTRELFIKGTRGKDFAVLEGAMGLYDGLGGIREEGSAYHLAKVTRTPILLVVDAKGMGRSIIPLIAGFLQYDREGLIRGVLLNRISQRYYETIRPVIEAELGISVAGFLPERESFHMESRHLGLRMPDEVSGMRDKLREISEAFAETVSVEEIIRIARNAGELDEEPGKEITQPRHTEPGPVIAVARDEAFCFYYADNLRLLEEYGARLCFFSPLRDAGVPEGCHALLFGGGYPELYATRLAANEGMRDSVRRAAEGGMPVVAECGGFMYMHSALTDREGVCHAMAGVLPGTCFYTGRLVRFGYVELKESKSFFLPEGGSIKGHEFHYYDSTDNGRDMIATKPVTGKEYYCMMEDERRQMGFPHLYYPSNPAFAERFVGKAEHYGKGIGSV
ncbi:MAG: cobyrinate a,c-diamide synthase [Clostridium sp.]|nr:cobyrinate a,c-diamide synthase [Acetatifactor muris]MCM1527240.1 cobyrinate a,c-diamide synthase [Bacteroides sp.]MCM1563065.1 cobyrinate a,c-diamide synthase [Clostridium sp.]